MPSSARGTEQGSSLARLHALAMCCATDEQRERLNRLTAGVAPKEGYHKPLEHGFYVAEIAAILFEQQFREMAQLREMMVALTETPRANIRPQKKIKGG
jgi:hypothetical protein